MRPKPNITLISLKKKHCGKIKHPILRAEKSCQKIAGVEILWHIGKKRSLNYGVNPEQSE
jgi:hypothetical protein